MARVGFGFGVEAIPMDIITEILVWMDVKELVRFKCVCKGWYALISDLQFINCHLEHQVGATVSGSITRNPHLNLILIYREKIYTLSFGKGFDHAIDIHPHPGVEPFLKWIAIPDTDVVGSCNGVLCFSDSKGCLSLYNPSIRAYKRLPVVPIPPYPHSPLKELDLRKNVGFGYEACTNDYRVVVIFQYLMPDTVHSPSNVKSHKVMSYSLKKDSWESIDGFDSPSIYLLDRIYSFGKLVNSMLHWIGMKSRGKDYVILGHDLKGKQHKIISMPRGCQECQRSWPPYMEALGGCLSLLWCNSTSYDAWIMRDHSDDESWTRLFRILFKEDIPRGLALYCAIQYDNENHKVLFGALQAQRLKLVWYELRERQISFVDIPHDLPVRTLKKIELYSGSLVPLF